MAFTPLPGSITSCIPNEVYERIIDHLYDSSDSLQLCSRVCKSWLPACRFHLFEEVKLSPTFISFIRSSSNGVHSILPYIRRIALGGVWFDQERDELEEIIDFLVHRSPCRDLVLETWSWNYMNAKTQGLLLAAEGDFFTKVTTIDMTYVRFPSLDIMKRFLNGLARLESLYLDNVTWDEDATSDIAPSRCGDSKPQFTTSIRHLRICGCDITPLLAWMFPITNTSLLLAEEGITTTPHLHLLSIPEALEQDVIPIQRALSQLGPWLEGLEIGFILQGYGTGNGSNDILNHLDLSQNINLRHLTLTNITLYRINFHRSLASLNINGIEEDIQGGDVTHDEAFNWVSSLVSSVNSDSFTSLTIGLWLTSEPDLDLLEWQTLGRLLMKGELNDDFVLRFLISGVAEGGKDVREWVKNRLSLLPEIQARQLQLEYA